MRTRIWDTLAARLADLLARVASDAPRGVVELHDLGCIVAFANDRYATDPRSRRAVDLIRRGLPSIGLDVLGFGLSGGSGRSWAMVVDAEPSNFKAFSDLLDLVWHSWARAARREDRGGRARIDWRQVSAANDAIERARESPAWTYRLARLAARAGAFRQAPGRRSRRRPSAPPREEAAWLADTWTIPIRRAAPESGGSRADRLSRGVSAPDDPPEDVARPLASPPSRGRLTTR